MPTSSHHVRRHPPQNLFSSNFHSLSVRDLLDARDHFHVHLAYKQNVFSTAIGRYLIRDSDPDTKERVHERHLKRSDRSRPRTLFNSSARDWSWPCVLVFVNHWQTLRALRSKPDHVIPPFVYMPDGRIVPICVVLVESTRLPARTMHVSGLNHGALGIGSPIFVDAQGGRRMGTAACMVSDGSDFYLLTNTHLAGELGRPVRALLKGIPEVIGTTHGTRNLTERTFSDIYPSLPGRDSVVNIDAAIVRVNDAKNWDPDVLSQTLGQVADFSAETASLDWIGLPVVGRGAASGEMRGEIKALFYRYKSVGGRDYVADLLIGSRSGGDTPLVTQPGDSGSLWCLEGVLEDNTLSPLALEWGGQRIQSGKSPGEFLQFSLATSMAVILRELSLDVIQDPSAERTQYWGPVGHYKIGQQACFLVENGALKKFFAANINNISFSSDEQIQLATHQLASAFVPLSDVPDVVWKRNINKVKPGVTRPMENWNHYADIDLPGANGKTLLDLYLANNRSLDWSVWTGFYKSAPVPSASPSKSNASGALPFRVWQIFAELVGYAKKGDGARFLTAAGCLAHYVGDSCQPLHSSQHSDGLNGASTGVHSTYEDNMVDAFADHIAAGMGDAIANLRFKPRTINNPRDAAIAVMDLMNFCHTLLPPETICQVYDRARPGAHKSATKAKDVLEALWDQCGQQTIEVIAAGAVTLGALWQAAFTLAGTPDSDPWLSATYDGAKDLMPIYEDNTFLPSLHLAYLGKTDLPGSDAPSSPPKPSGGVEHTEERGHQPKRGSAPARPSAFRTTHIAGKAAKKTPRKKKSGQRKRANRKK
jgi:hypothetical protein